MQFWMPYMFEDTSQMLEIARAAVDAMLRQVGPGDRVALLLGDLGGRPTDDFGFNPESKLTVQVSDRQELKEFFDSQTFPSP